MTGRREAGAYALLALVFAASRLALVWRFPPHVDEATFATWTLRGYENPEDRFIPLVAGQQPLLEWLGMLVMRLGPEPLTALRLVSLAAGLGTGAVVVWLARRLGGAPAGLAAGVLWVVVPLSLVYSVLGLYDPLATFFVAAAAALAILHAERPRLDLALLLGSALGLGLLTKLTTQVSFVVVAASALLLVRRDDRAPRLLARWAGGVLLALAVAWLLYRVMLLSQFSDDVRAGREGALAVHSVGAFLDEPGRWLEANWPPLRGALAGYLTLPLVVALAVGAATGLRHRAALTGVLLVWAVVPIAGVAALADVPFVRWLLVAAPPLVTLAALGAVELCAVAWALVRGRRARPLAAAAVALVLVVPALVLSARILATPARTALPGRDDLDYLREWSAGGPWSHVVRDLRELAGGGELVVASAGNGFQYPALALRHDGVTLVEEEAGVPAEALLGLENGAALPDGPDVLTWHRVGLYERPRDGVPVVLLERAVRYGGRAMASPDELRAAIGADADFDAWIDEHPAARRWLVAWSQAYGNG